MGDFILTRKPDEKEEEDEVSSSEVEEKKKESEIFEKFLIAKIVGLWEDRKKIQYVDLNWYFFPQNVHKNSKPHEIYSSELTETEPIDVICKR